MSLSAQCISRISFALLLAGALCACKSRAEGSATFTVDGVNFTVPADHLIPNNVFFLSSTEVTAFNFIVNPGSSGDSLVLVNVEPRAPLCKAAEHAVSPLVRNACSGQQPQSPKPGFASSESRVYLDDFHDRWTYGPQEAPFASCFETGTTGIAHGQECFGVGTYKGIIYTMSYPDDQVNRLSEIRRELESLLSEWQVAK